MAVFNYNWFFFYTPEDDHMDGRNIFEDTLLLCCCCYYVTCSWGIGWTDWKFICEVKCKGKGLPQQAEVAQGVLGRLKAPDFLDVRNYEGGKLSSFRIGRFYPRRNSW
jgi:hypothetical protein